jgi:hypothetical protein
MQNLKSGTTIHVHGWVMLKGLNQGLYKVLSQDETSYTFAKANGRKAICRHYKNSVHGSIDCFNRGDNNGIQIIN